MRDKITKIIVGFASAICLLLFVLARFPVLPSSITDSEIVGPYEKGVYGDLYNMCRVDFFKTQIPEFSPFFRYSSRNVSMDEAGMLIFGDSYFGGSRVLKNFPEIIADSLNIKVHYESESLPLKSLSLHNYKKAGKKFLLYEATERRILEDFKREHSNVSGGKVFFSDLVNSVVPNNIELKYLYMLQNSVFTSRLYSAVMNFRFDAFGLISDLTPVYSKNPPFLFYYQNVNRKNTSYYYKFSQSELENVADNLFKLSQKLSDEYNLEFIFMPVPSSYTINHTLLNNDEYNNFLPRLYSELEKRKVKYIDLYNPFKKSNKQLYYPTDTHWNEIGMNLAFSEFSVFLNSITMYRNSRLGNNTK